MSTRYTQTKSEAARHSDILKTMLKRPENKVCADCKRNDPRWASTNLGCFMCIRCSGIHRGMGVHITRIKSVDLDSWTPDQIANIQRWGNRRANAYWEAHLKAGHMPPEHKIESFIRSKYELKRWAMEGPVPEPETLDGDEGGHYADASTATANMIASSSSRSNNHSAGSSRSSGTTSRSKSTATTSIDLFADPPSSTSTSVPVRPPSNPHPTVNTSRSATQQVQSSAGGGLFDLDLGHSHAPVPTTTAQPKRDAKADIMSLFAAAPPPRSQQPVSNSHQQQQTFGGGGFDSTVNGFAGLSIGGTNDLWSQSSAATITTNNGSGGGGSGSEHGGFGAFESFTSNATTSLSNMTSSQIPKASADLFGATDVWGGSSSNNDGNPKADSFGEFGSVNKPGSSSNDAFSDIWK
ncbi:ARF GAP with effector function(s) [Microbotryomycetes sp. JL221]|nr:ARF GAP with effector function(s) [Microbotryomycetes sp. JL221]